MKLRALDKASMKRKRAVQTAAMIPDSKAVAVTEPESSDSEQGGAFQLDAFDEDLATPIAALDEAVASTVAFLQPSEKLSHIVRTAAKVKKVSELMLLIRLHEPIGDSSLVQDACI